MDGDCRDGGCGSKDAGSEDYENLPTSASVSTHMTAGAMAGILEHSIMYPVDSVKVRRAEDCGGKEPGEQPLQRAHLHPAQLLPRGRATKPHCRFPGARRQARVLSRIGCVQPGLRGKRTVSLLLRCPGGSAPRFRQGVLHFCPRRGRGGQVVSTRCAEVTVALRRPTARALHVRRF